MTTTPETFRNEMPFWGHVEELRKAILKSIFVFFCFFLCFFFYHEKIIDYITSSLPQQKVEEIIYNPTEAAIIYTPPEGWSVKGNMQLNQHSWLIEPQETIEIFYQPSLILLSPYEGLLAAFKVSFWTALAASSPFSFYFLMQFLFPAFHLHEKKMVIPVIVFGYLLGGLGFIFASKITLPFANKYLWDLNNSLGRNMWTLPAYLDHLFMILYSHIFAFAAMGALLISIHFRMISATFLAAYRRHFIICALVLSAILTPPDILSQLYLTTLLAFFYELAILYGKMRFLPISEI